MNTIMASFLLRRNPRPHKTIVVFIMCISTILLCTPSFAKANRLPTGRPALPAGRQGLTAKSALVIDASTNKTLFAINPHKKLIPASTVKLMTALVVLENISLNREIIISRYAASIQPSKAYLSCGQSYKARDLLTACLSTSANDATVALSEAVAGSEAKFVKLMNKKARVLGMFNTNFLNSTGLPAEAFRRRHGLPVKKNGQYSTAYDLAVLMKYASYNPTILSILTKPVSTICGSDGKYIRLVNHNKLLFKNKNNNILLKTGYTIKSKHCFVGVKMAGDRRYIFTLLGSKRPWDDLKYILKDKPYKLSRVTI